MLDQIDLLLNECLRRYIVKPFRLSSFTRYAKTKLLAAIGYTKFAEHDPPILIYALNNGLSSDHYNAIYILLCDG